jgi:hypothetical protein
LVLTVAASKSWAADPASPEPPKVKVGGLLFAHYGLDLTEGAEDFNSFDLDRAYLRADASVTRSFGVRVTLDAGREASQSLILSDGSTVTVPEDTKIRVFVKQAWVQYQPSDAFQLRAGAVETALVPWEESFERLRYVNRVALEEDKLQSSADLGVSVGGKASKGRLDWMAGVFDGESYGAPEVDAGKTFQGRLAVDPLAGSGSGDVNLPLVVFVEEGLHQGGDPRTTGVGLVGFRSPYFLGTAQLDWTTSGGVTGLGQDAVLEPRIPDVGFVLGELDHFDPDQAAGDDAITELWAGVGHVFLDRVELALTYERAMSQATPDTPKQGVFLRGEAGF